MFQAGRTLKTLTEINMGDGAYSSPVAARGVLYILTRSTLYAIGAPAEGAK